ncbi:growth hormone secretagogue receptor type 1 [Biomphalaria glabrata]|nr:growth hormone secretagogue receptor type 1-like [Biomphalaria glabrata]
MDSNNSHTSFWTNESTLYTQVDNFPNANRQLLSTEGRNLFILVNHVILCSFISMFGVGANSVNILVFLKQGLKKSLNLCFFLLAVTDLMGLLTQLWHNFCLNSYVSYINAPLVFGEIQILTAGKPNACLVRITGWITVYITAERCLSIAMPLKIKQIVTFERKALILLFIYLVNVASLVPLYFSAYFSWNFIPAKNTTFLGVSYRSNKLVIQDLLYIFQASLALAAFACTVMFTSILIVSFKKNAEWRQKSTFDSDQTKTKSKRENRTVRMVIVVACVLIVCYTPACVSSLVSAVIQDYSITGRQSNIFEAVWSFGFLLHSVNSSINMLLYYRMSGKYKTTVQEMFSSCFKQNVSVQSKG